MFLLIFENEVPSQVEVITAIPKIYRKPKRYHYDILRPIAEQFAQRRVLYHRLSSGEPVYMADYNIDWSCWDKRGLCFDHAQDYIIRCVDTSPGPYGSIPGPSWKGIETIPCPVGNWLKGGVEIEANDRFTSHETFKAFMKDAVKDAVNGGTVNFNGDYAASFAYISGKSR